LWGFSGTPSKSVYNENIKPIFVISFLLMMVVVVVVTVPLLTNETLFHHLLAQENK
jgi:hypothetical protein